MGQAPELFPVERANYLRKRYSQERKANYEGPSVILERLGLTAVEQTPIEELIFAGRTLHAFRILHDRSASTSAYVYMYLPPIINAGTLSMHTHLELLVPRYIGSGAINEIKGKLNRLGLALAGSKLV